MPYYSKSIVDFLSEDTQSILGALALAGGNDPNQMLAWEEEIYLLKTTLLQFKQENGRVIFEYTIPRMGKRIDVALLLRGVIYILEFKCGSTAFLRGDAEQVMDYALDLKYFHEESAHAPIVPILIATEALESEMVLQTSAYDDLVYTPIFSNAKSLATTLENVSEKIVGGDLNICDWECSNYQPTPTIIEAARTLYAGNTVENITRTEASGKTIRRTTEFVKKVVEETKERNGKTICFVTGVPGAGKTLVGLNIAFLLDKKYRKTKKAEDVEAVYMSGNGPLVKVLRAALAKDKIARDKAEGIRTNKEDAEREASAKVQGISEYREQMLKKLKVTVDRKVDGELSIDPQKAKWSERNGYAEPEHITVFDEAQRCWNKAKIADWLHRGGSYGNKMKIDDFPMSEAEFLIWSLNLRPDWAVIICLVGGGQEIHTGEAGIGEWIRAINERFPEWRVCIADQLKGEAYEKGNTQEEIRKIKNCDINSELHLSVSMRSFRAERLANWVENVLHFQIEDAQREYAQLASNYPIVLTRDVNKAKAWLRQQARGSERYGLIVSSKAARLRPLAIDVKRKVDVVNWFLGERDLITSSYYLEDSATEFDIQGLELDWTCVVWDGDMRYTEAGWTHHKFNTTSWSKINDEQAQMYQENAYRVLLTRARQGMVICVPEGSNEDPTRNHAFYNGTYEYLKQLGVKEI